MNRRVKLLFALVIPVFAIAQSPAEDAVKLKAALDWLDSKLNYIYYDGAGQQWWNNTFYVNDENEVTIKHIASAKPNTANIRSKTYTIRRFQIEDINPRSLKITDIKESRGRIVKGQMLEIRTFAFQDLIHKSINNRRASSTSFLFLSFPETLIDSVSNYAQVVITKLEEAILASTQLYASNDESDIDKILNAMTGVYEADKGSSWKTEREQPNVLKLERNNGKIEYFGYDQKNESFYLLVISDRGIEKQNFDLAEGDRLKLMSESTQDSIIIHTPNSFTIDGNTYFRQ